MLFRSIHHTLCAAILALFALAPAGPLGAQAARPPAEFSGVIYPQYRMTTDAATRDANAGNAASRFDIERVYLTFRMPAGDNGNIRVTTDVFNNGSSCSGCYAGWNVRIKYAYFHYDLLRDIGGRKGFNGAVRFGMLHTALIEHVETFWPRWVSKAAAERAGYFSSADVGVAGLVTLPNQWGELYATVANGPGYERVEADPYQDVSARLSITPWGREPGWQRSLTLSPWFYRGRTASRYIAAPGAASTAAADGLDRNRAGVFAGLRDRRLTAGFEMSQRTETIETGSSLATRGTYDNSGRLTSVFALVRPAELFSGDSARRSRLGVLARVDDFTPYSSAVAAGTQTTSSATRLLIAGLWWELNQRATFALDLQHLRPLGGSTTPESKILFLHGQISF